MLWIIALLALIAGYFSVLAGTILIKWKENFAGKKMILILIFRNSEESVEAIMWDLFRLKSWNYQGLSFLVTDDKSYDDTLQVLKALQKKHPFLLVKYSLVKRFERIMRLQGKEVMVLNINGPESPRLVRRRIVCQINQCIDKLAG
ncbi:MAG: hypothetical protein AAGU27_28715 [Dehalobacterium sp.]